MNIKKRIGGLLSASALLLLLCAPVSAIYVDLAENHWAFPQMDEAVALGIINGVGDGRINPQGELTWSQFLTMMCRAFAPERYRAARETLPWDQAGYQAARDAGFLSDADHPAIAAETLETPISRQDTAVLLSRAVPEDAALDSWRSYVPSAASEALSDYDTIDPAHRDAVDRLFELLILRGKSDGSFGADDTLQRADGTVLLMRTLEYVDRAHFNEPVTLTLHTVDLAGAEAAPPRTVEGRVGAYLYSLVDRNDIPEGFEYHGTLGTQKVSSACADYTLVVRRLSQAELDERGAWERYYSGELTWEQLQLEDFWLRRPDENPRKYLLLFGNTTQRRFGSKAEAEQNMKTVSVPVWRIQNGAKVAGTASVQVHAALADEVVAIFTEIFNDPEQFPILNLTGYGWRGDSAKGEHNCGTAIDINSDQNYQVRDGKAQAGSLWQPGVNPYSITENGSVVRVFTEHGWSWGGDAWAWSTDPTTGYHDYMHFSYMGG